jgi:hypothetical protein
MLRAWAISFLLASASVTLAADSSFDVHLLEPAEGVDVLAGSTVAIGWDATNTPDHVEEWEAFLSIDGGRTYPIRLTPHLDVAIHRFTFTVPFLPGAEACVLLRFGDERDEQRFAFPGHLRITGTIPLHLLSYETLPDEASATSEEDDHGEKLVEWVEGSRNGSRLRRVSSRDSLRVGNDAWSASQERATASAVGIAAKRIDTGTCRSLAERKIFTRVRPLDGLVSQRRARDFLTLSGRLNI